MIVNSLLTCSGKVNKADCRCSFEIFKSNICHHVRDMDDIAKHYICWEDA